MKKNIRILIISLLIILSSLTGVYAYWTDRINSQIDIEFIYDGCIQILEIPEPVLVEDLGISETEADIGESESDTGEQDLDTSDGVSEEPQEEND